MTEPLPTAGHVVWFRGDKQSGVARQRIPVNVGQPPPVDTNDPRWLACTDHHLACDCREAEQTEGLREYRADWQKARDAAQEVCAGHPTYPDYYDHAVGETGDFRYVPSGACCQCTGCQIIRKAHL